MNRFRNIALAVALSFGSLIGLGASTAQAQVPGSKAVPSAVQRIWIAKERVYIEVFVDNLERPGANPDGKTDITSYPYGEHYGNRLGDILPMRVRVFGVLPPPGSNLHKVEFDFAALRSGRLTIDPDPNNDPDWVFAKPESLGQQEGLTAGDALAPCALFLSILGAGVVVASFRKSNRKGRLLSWLIAAGLVAGVVYFVVLPVIGHEHVAPKALEMTEQPKVVTIKTPDGQERDAELWEMRLFVQTKRRPEPMNFWMEFSYCTELNANGQKDWHRADTPDFVVSGSYTGDKGRDLEVGNTNLVAGERPLSLSLLFYGLGSVMVLLPVGLLVTRFIQRKLAAIGVDDKMTPARVWAVLDPVLAKRKLRSGKEGYSFEPEDVVVIVKTFKQFVGFNGSVKQFESARGEYDGGQEIYDILFALEHRVLECKEMSESRVKAGKKTPGLSAKRYAELIKRIEKLCPRP